MAKGERIGKGHGPVKTFPQHEMKDAKGRRYPIDKGPAREGMRTGTGHDEHSPNSESKAIGELFRCAGRPDPLKDYKGVSKESDLKGKK
jgi:hypothetical protein